MIVAAILFAGCTDNSYKGIESEMAADEALPVHIVVGDPGDILHSKGSGAMDDEDDAVWEGRTINVFAFKRDLNSDYSKVSATGHDDCLIDGSIDTDGSLGGKEATVNAHNSYITWNKDEKTIYYLPGTQPYDFFAYFTDSPISDSNIYRGQEEVRITLDIDGSTDLMTAHASLTEEQLNRPGFTDMDKMNLNSYYFSAWTAKRNIHPVFYFDHHLTRFDFEMRSGWEDADDIIIDSLVIVSRRKAVFTVAHKNPSRLGIDVSGAPYERTALAENDGTQFRKDYWKLDYVEGSDEMTKIGGSLMVAPDLTYDAYLYLKQNLSTGVVKSHENHIALKSSEGRFSAGSQYVVSAVVYGLTEVEVSVTLTEWEDGGSVDIESDKPLTGKQK